MLPGVLQLHWDHLTPASGQRQEPATPLDTVPVLLHIVRKLDVALPGSVNATNLILNLG